MKTARRLGVAYGLSVFLLAPSGVWAQEEDTVNSIEVQTLPDQAEPANTEKSATRLEAVQVTGSRIKRADAETEQPVVRLTRKDLDRTGQTTVGEVLQTLPAAGSSLNTNINNGGTGATEVDLRNLGSNRVLVLVDGHRWISGLRSLSTNSVDLNTIPFALVERVDVLQDGASAVYGSDAVTGIVNIITKKKFTGLNVSSQYGAFTQGDGQQQLHTISVGNAFDGLFGGASTSIFGAFSFQDQKAVFAGDRRLSRVPRINAGPTRQSTFTPEGRALFVASTTTASPQNLGTTNCPNLAPGIAEGTVNSDTSVDLPSQAGGGNIGTVPNPMLTAPEQTANSPGLNLCDITRVAGSTGDASADYRPYNGAEDSFNFALTNYLATPLRSYNAYLSMEHEFTDRLRFSAQGLYSLRQSVQQLAAHPISIGDIGPIIGGLMPGSTQSFNQATFIPASNPFNPTRNNVGGDGPQDIGRLVNSPRNPGSGTNVDPCNGTGADPTGSGQVPCGPAGALFYSGAVLRRIVEGDPRVQEQNVPTRFGRFGLSGDFDLFALNAIDWELGYSYGVTSQSQTLFNNFRQDRIRNAIVGNYVEGGQFGTRADQGIPDDVPLCVDPCVPLNLLGGAGSITQANLDYIRFDGHSNTRQSQSDLYLNIATALPIRLFSDDIGVAIGVERRTSKYNDLPSPEQIDNTTSGLTAQPTTGALTAKEAYMEIDLPIVKDLPLVRDLGISVAGRLSDYGEFGKANTGKLGLRYKPFEDLLLRSTFSTSFRAPNTGELFLSNAGSYPALTDPCAAPDAGSTAETNCNNDGVAPYTQTVVQFLSPFTGNRDLKSEKSHSLTAGMVFSPKVLEGFDFTIDYFQIKLDNFISPPGAQFILDQCYGTPGRAFCNFISRAPNGQLSTVTNSFQNFPSTETSGLDFSLNYALPSKGTVLEALGRFKIAAGATFLSSYSQSVIGSDGGIERTGYAGNNDIGQPLPRWKINPSLQWQRGPWSGSLNTRIVWGYNEICDDGIAPTLVDQGLCSDPSARNKQGDSEPRNRVRYAWKSDLQLGYKLRAYKTDLTLGMQNLFNQDPPLSYSVLSNSFDSSYWLPGQLPYLSLKKDF